MREPTMFNATGHYRLLSGLYHVAIADPFDRTLADHACRVAAIGHGLSLALLLLPGPTGELAITGCSAESALWMDLKRLPQRWDGTVLGQGPASDSARLRRPMHALFEQDALLPWREAARKDRVAAAAAWPIELLEGRGVLEIFGSRAALFQDASFSERFQETVDELQRFFADLRLLQQQRVLADEEALQQMLPRRPAAARLA